MRRFLLFLALMLAPALLAGAQQTVRPQQTAALVPAHGALLGVFYGDGNIASTSKRIGRTPPVHLSYFSWQEDWTVGVQRDFDRGLIPLISWEPDKINFHDIDSGKLDAVIRARARAAAALNKPFFLDFAAEMNGDDAWSGNNPALYVAAFRHIHDIFAAAGATNVVWAWCPNVEDIEGGNARTMQYYPGDAYVDWTGVDGYNWQKYNGRWLSFAQLFARIYPLLAARHKPILIGEMASAETGGDKAAWIDGIVPTLRDNFPMVKALVWFDINKETDWRIGSSPATQAAFVRMAANPYFNP